MNKNQLLKNKKLSFTLIGYIILISIIFTLIQTVFLLKSDYDKSIKTVNKSIEQIKNTRIDSISMAIWQLDNNQLDILIESILKLPGINYIEIKENDFKPRKIGIKKTKYIIESNFPLIHKNFKNNKLGTIYIQGNYENNINTIQDTILLKILLETIKIFSIAIFIIFIVHKLIIKHLETMAKYTMNLDSKKLSIPLVLNKKRSQKNLDAIDIVADAINTMRKNLLKDIEQQETDKLNLKLTNAKLEEEIEIRTKIEEDAIDQKERILQQYNTIVKLTTDEELFEKSFKDGVYFVLKESVNALHVDRVSFWEFKNENEIKCSYRYYKKDDVQIDEEKTISIDKLPKYINYLKNNKVLDASDVYSDERTIEYNQEDMKKANIKSMLDVSITFHEKTYGLICFETLEKHKEWAQDEISFATRISDQINNLLVIKEWKKAQAEIIELNNSLEITVQERTKELQQNLKNLKIAQKQLVESEKMASLGSLVAGVAHEINTPVGISLTGITHFQHITKELKKAYEEDNLSQDEFEDYIKTSYEISNSVFNSLLRAAEQIRSFKQVAVDQSNEQTRTFNVKKYIEEILLSLHNKIKKTKHTITIHCDNNLCIEGFPGSLSQIITNFIMNSLIHAFKEIEQGKIDIYVKKINDNIELIYKDNGIGINKENLKKIFDPFFTTNRKGGGSGLGLNIVYNIVQNVFKGTIEAKSTLNKGLTFTIKFPLKERT